MIDAFWRGGAWLVVLAVLALHACIQEAPCAWCGPGCWESATVEQRRCWVPYGKGRREVKCQLPIVAIEAWP